MIDFVTANKRCALFAGMGTGKTSALLWVLDLWKLLGEVDKRNPILVIGPMRVARDTWPQEVQKWENFSDLLIVPLSGTLEQRLAKLKIPADIFTISYELLPWLVSHWLARWPYKVVVADESDRLKGFREKRGGVGLSSERAGKAGQRAHALGRVAHNLTDRWINLTGTPAPNGLKDLWGQTWYIDRGARLGRTYSAFTNRWFRTNQYTRKVEPMPHSDREIYAALQDVCLTVDPKDYFDLKEPRIIPVPVTLAPAVKARYKELEREMFLEFGEFGNVEAFNSAALTNKCLQFANGAVYTDNPKWAPVHDGKLEALESILHETGGEPLIVAYSFKSDVARIRKAFPGSVELSTVDGMRAFMAGGAQIGLAHPKSMGHGIDGLQHVCHSLVRFGHGWDHGQRIQMLERIGPMRQFQAGFDRTVDVYDIVCTGTLDEDVIEAHVEKRSVEDQLLLAMKRRKQ
jgi:hypothetical protein